MDSDSNGYLHANRQRLAAITNRDHQAIAMMLQDTNWTGGTAGSELCGLLLGPGGDTIPFASDNPWGVPTDARLCTALKRIWAPVSASCPTFPRVLGEEVFGLALVRVAGEYRLGYLYLFRHGSEDRLLDVLWGTPPSATVAIPDLAAVLDLAAVHGSLTSYTGFIRCDSLDRTLGDLLATFHEECDEVGCAECEGVRTGAYDRYRFFAGSDPDYWPFGSLPAQELGLIDLDSPESTRSPRVARYDLDGLDSEGRPFWEWFEKDAPSYLLRR